MIMNGDQRGIWKKQGTSHLEGLRSMMKNSQDGHQTGYLPNTSLEHYYAMSNCSVTLLLLLTV